MKSFLLKSLMVLVFISLATSSFADVLELPSKISAVTVYPGSAHLTRTITLDLPAGDHTIVFNKITPPLDENTLSVSGEGNAEVKIYGGYIKQEFLEQTPDDRVKDFQQKIQGIDDEVLVQNSSSQVLDQKKEYLNSIKIFAGGQLPKDLVTSMPSVENLKGVGDYLASELANIEKQKNDIRIKLRDLNNERNTLAMKMSAVSGNFNNVQRRLAVDLGCAKAGKFTLNVSYLVNGANWRPLYDARTDIAKSEIQFTSFGVVKQSTGEDWQDVNLTLSTAKPNLGGRMPYVTPWVITGSVPQKGIAGRIRDASAYMADKTAELGTISQYEAYYQSTDYAIDRQSSELKENRVVTTPAQMAYSQVAQNGLSVTYKIARPISLKSDGSENKFPIATQVLKSEFEYSGYPKATELSYLGSEVVNSKELQLLAGQVNLFLEGDFVGKSDIQNVGPGEKFSLYLGVNENVKVKREQIEKKVNDILIAGIPSPNRTTTIKMKITVENYENRKIKYNLFESIPTAQNDKQIKINVNDVNPQPFKKDWDDRKGVWQWIVELEPKAKKEITYTYVVEHSRDMQVAGL